MNLTINVIQWNGTGNPPINLTVDTGGITINGTSNVAPSSTLVVSVDNDGIADISVNQTDYHSYSVEISNVYNTDKVIYIIMAPIRDIGDLDYNRPHPMHFFFVSPCGFTVDYYSATSSAGNITWYINNEEYLTGLTGSYSFCAPGDYQIKTRIETFSPDGIKLWDRQWANTDEPTYLLPGQLVGQGETGNVISGTYQDISEYLPLDLEVNTFISEYRPDFDITIDGLQQTDDCCFTKDEDVTLTPIYTLNREGSLESEYTITYNVTDPDGIELDLEGNTIPLNVFDKTFVLSLTKLGIYTVTATLDDTVCDNQFTVIKTIDTCNFITIDYVDCNTYTVNNKSSNKDVVITIDHYGEEEINPISLEAGESVEIVFSEVSLYFLTAVYIRDEEEVSETYVLNNYCVLESCLSKLIQDVLCEDTRACAKCPPLIDLNRLNLLYATYMSELNSEYAYNNYYTVLEDSDLQRFADIKSTMDKIKALCTAESCMSSNTVTELTKFFPSSAAGGCGCSK